MAPKPATRAQKAAAKAFVKALKVLKKSTRLDNGPLAELLGIKPKRLSDWLTGRRNPEPKAQDEVRAAAHKSHTALSLQAHELFSLIAVTTKADACEDPSKD